jgi:hypothetical protein
MGIFFSGTVEKHLRNYITKKKSKMVIDKEHGAVFSEPPVKSIRNYLMKYTVKGFRKSGSKYGESDDRITGELVFYSFVKKYRWRLFGAT